MTGKSMNQDETTDTLENLLDIDIPQRLEAQMRSQLQAFRARLQTGQDESSRHRLWRWARPAAVAAAACAAVILIVSMLHDGTASVYAQAIEALKQARTAHAEGFRIKDGKPVKEIEIWYDASHGVRERSVKADGTVQERLDDGKAQWIYLSSTKTAIKTRSSDPVGVITKLLNYDQKMEKMKFERLAQADKSIDGVACLAYASVFPEGKTRKVLWIDNKHRVRRFDRELLGNGQWMMDRSTVIVYDQPIPRERLQPDFGPGVAVVDSTAFKEIVNLDRNILKAEILGLVLAVHEAHRLDNGTILLVWSIRPTPATIAKLGPLSSKRHGTKLYGDAQITNLWPRPRDQGHLQPMELATWTQDGVQVQWTVLIPKGQWPESTKVLPLHFSVYSRYELQKAFEKDGQEWYRFQVPLGELTLPDEEPQPTEKAHRRVYEQAGAVYNASAFQSAVSVTGKNRPLNEQEKQDLIKNGMQDARSVETMSTTPQHRPNELTPEQFIENVQHNYECLMKLK